LGVGIIARHSGRKHRAGLSFKAVEVAATSTAWAARVLNHALLHQAVIGEECLQQLLHGRAHAAPLMKTHSPSATGSSPTQSTQVLQAFLPRPICGALTHACDFSLYHGMTPHVYELARVFSMQQTECLRHSLHVFFLLSSSIFFIMFVLLKN
jgi:hypothetical protein